MSLLAVSLLSAGSLIGDNVARGQTVTVNVTEAENGPASGSIEWYEQQLPLWQADYYAQFEFDELIVVAADIAIYEALTDGADRMIELEMLHDDWQLLQVKDEYIKTVRVI